MNLEKLCRDSFLRNFGLPRHRRPVNLKNSLCQIHANHRIFRHGCRPFRSVALTPLSWHIAMPSGRAATTPSHHVTQRMTGFGAWRRRWAFGLTAQGSLRRMLCRKIGSAALEFVPQCLHQSGGRQGAGERCALPGPLRTEAMLAFGRCRRVESFAGIVGSRIIRRHAPSQFIG